MSLFDELQQWEIIEKPKQKGSYKRILSSTKTDEKEDEKKKWKELCKKKKEELSEEEFNKWRQKERYKRNKKRIIERELDRYHKNKAEEEAMLEEIYKNVYDPIPYITPDEMYAEKYKKDDQDSWGKYRFYWRASRLNWTKPSKIPKYTAPIRICKRKNIKNLFSLLGDMQDRAYEYIKPHLDEISLSDFWLSKKQFFTKAPMWYSSERMQEILSGTDISNNQICTVASALLRDKYIASELYMGRVSFLVGDVIITQNWNIFRPVLDNNIPRLTKDTVEELHQKRMDWLKKETDDLQIYALWDCYFLTEQPNERETLFYIVPT